MASSLTRIDGIVKRGHQVASGKGGGCYPQSTIKMQKPFFKNLGLDLSEFYNATINISIAPFTFSMERPKYLFKNVRWTSLHQPENFSFSGCKIIVKGNEYNAYIYYPHPETKTVHFQDSSTIEVIAPLIPDITYGDKVQLLIDESEVSLEN